MKLRPLKQTKFRSSEKLNDIAFVDQIYYETLTRDIYWARLRDRKGYYEETKENSTK